MYNLTLVQYATPIKTNTSMEKRGNLSPIVSAIRAIYFALNERNLNYEVIVEGLNEQNLADVSFKVTGEVIGERKQEFRYERSVNLGSGVDLPALFYTLDVLIDDQVNAQLFQQGNNQLVNACLNVGVVKNSWVMRIYSKAVMYELTINNNPDYFGRAVTLNVEIDEALADDEDRRAILEVATVLADNDFRESRNYPVYTATKGGKELDKFEIYQLGDLRTDSAISKGLHNILDNEHYASDDFLALSFDNLEQVIPRYLVLADKMRRKANEMENSLRLDLSRHDFQVGQLSNQSPSLEEVLDVAADTSPDVADRIRNLPTSYTGRYDSSVHEQIVQQLMLARSRMQRTLSTLEEFKEMIGKLEQSGIVASRGFEPDKFFAMTSKYGINETAVEALALLGAHDE